MCIVIIDTCRRNDTELIPWNRVLEKLLVAQVVKKPSCLFLAITRNLRGMAGINQENLRLTGARTKVMTV
jgi:hypothetical protein